MDFLKKLWKNDYFRNVLYAILGVGGFIAITIIFLNVYTRHGQSQPVPDFVSMTLEEVEAMADKENLRIEVTDSIYRQGLRPGGVIDQNPKAGTKVKKNRKIFLVLNCVSPRKTNAPNVVGYSLRQGKAVLENQGFKLGRLIYKSDMATNNILGQQYKGRPLEPGTSIYAGSEIDLIVGLNSETPERTNIPLVLNLSIDAARSRLGDASLNVGKVRYDGSVQTVTDSIEAFVYRQFPAESSSLNTSLGSSVELYLTVDQAKRPK